MLVYYCNLTNGLEHLDRLGSVRMIRIQSTWCEQKRWNDIIFALSDDLLFNLAIGNKCVICDCSAKNRIPRALWQGLEVIEYFLNKYWFGKNYSCKGRAKGMENYLCNITLTNSTIKKLKYYKKFLLCDSLLLEGQYFQTNYDGDYEYFKEIISNFQREK